MRLLNVTLPVFNEERILADSTTRLIRFLEEHWDGPYELVIANNGSTDSTAELADVLAETHPAVRAIHLPVAGRGRALKQAWLESRADLLSYMDVDLSTDLAAFPSLCGLLTGGGCDLALGSRRMSGAVVQRSLRREFPSWCYHLLFRRLFRVPFSDVQCGFKAIRKCAAERLLPLVEEPGWFMDAELVVLADRMGFKVGEIPVRWREGRDSRVRLGRDAFATMCSLLRQSRRLGGGRFRELALLRQQAGSAVGRKPLREDCP